MARQFTNSVVTDGGGSTAVNAASMQVLLRTIITANPAWQLVETMNGNQFVVDIYKCLASASGLPKDFFVAFSRQLSNGNFAMHLSEDYNATTHVMSNFVSGFFGAARPVDPTTGLPNPTLTYTYNAASGVGTVSGSGGLLPSMTFAATMPYTIVVDSDHLVIRLGTYTRYIGAVESLITTVPDPMPLVSMSLSNNTTGGGSPRNPGLGASGVAGSHSIDDALKGSTNDLYPSGGISAVADPFVGGLQAYELGAINFSSPLAGGIRGRVKKIRKTYALPVGGLPGDTFTIAGKVWYVVGTLAGQTMACLVDPGP